MNAAVLHSEAPLAPLQGGSVLRPEFNRLDDETLLAHFSDRRGVWFEPVVDVEETRSDRIEALLTGAFEFNGESHRLADPIHWLRNPSVDVEWHILLHKFYYAVGLGLAWQRTGDTRYVRRWRQLLAGWMDSTPPGFIAADVTGRRVQNWIYSLHYLVLHGGGAPLDGPFVRRLLHSLHEQVEFLCNHLTPKRNHRTLELMAIMLAGVALPELTRAAHWREFALAQTAANLQADLLPDGVHCELSTDYHHLALRNWLQVRSLAVRNGLALPAGMDEALQRGFEFSLHVHQPRGLVPSLSDGDVHSYLPLLAQAADLFHRDDMRFVATRGAEGLAPAQRLAHFAHAGYHVLRSAWDHGPQHTQAQHLVLDCGPLGEGNHGHFDALSFELAAHGRALVVDPGRYTYSEAGEVNWRVHFRSTAAHNTVCVDGRNQTRYAPKPIKEASRHALGQLRHRILGPAPATTLLEAASSPRLDLLHGRAVSAEYDAIHERVIAFIDQRYWIVSDTVRSESLHQYAVRLQLSAAAQGLAVLDDGVAHELHSPGLAVAVARAPAQHCEIEAGWVSSRYGHKEAAPRLCATAEGCDADFDAVLMPWQGKAPQLAVTRLPVPGAAHALRITVNGGEFIDTWFHARGAVASDVSVAGVGFSGRWLHLRHTVDGGLLQATTHTGATLRTPAAVAAVFVGSHRRGVT
ncbi:MAG: alginate lyase family protein [Rubrivivax sp.]|nr:alginate lyase family protein [Rubrivivax sp.]